MGTITHAWFNTGLTITLFLVSTALQLWIFWYKLQHLKKLYYEIAHYKERRAQTVYLLRQRRLEGDSKSRKVS